VISSRNLVGDPAQLNVLIEAIANDGFRATGGPPFEVTAQGTTREEALARLREAIDQRLSEGSVLVPLEIDTPEENPWTAVAGMFRNEPLFDEWQEAIAEYRRKVDEGPDDGHQ
jgi:predicted RNase H-like HicB family nuclease